MTIRDTVRRLRSGGGIGAVTTCMLCLCCGAAGEWEQRHKLTADDAEAYERFGNSVSISGNLAAIGAPPYPEEGTGSAYVFCATTGQQLHKLTAEDAAVGDWFGSSVSISGKIVVVGAPYQDNQGYPDDDFGAAYIFDAVTGHQLHKLTAADAARRDFFGRSVSVCGNLVVVGATGDDDAGLFSGSAYIFDATTGQQLHKLTAEDAEENTGFGWSISISGNVIAIGAPGSPEEHTGSAYVFCASTGQQLHKLIADDAAVGDRFGWSVSISGNLVAVGSMWDEDAGERSGSAYVFCATTGEQIHKLTAVDAQEGDLFGVSVSISGNLAVVGTLYDDDAGTDAGSAYIFDAITGQQLHKMIADDTVLHDEFGGAVSISGDTVVVGARLDDDGGEASGSAYIFERSQCPADIDQDGDVDAADLLALLGAWGECP